VKWSSEFRIGVIVRTISGNERIEVGIMKGEEHGEFREYSVVSVVSRKKTKLSL